MPHVAPFVLIAGRSLQGQSLGFHAYSLRIDNVTNQWLQEETTLTWIPPYSLGLIIRLFGTGVALLMNQAPQGQPQLGPIAGEYATALYSDDYRTENPGAAIRQYTLVQAVSDLTEGPQPVLPPVGVDRLYADPQGNIHHLHSDGTDLMLVDANNVSTSLYPVSDPHYQAMMNATAVGGDASGTVANIANNAAHVPFRVGAAGSAQTTATVPLTLPGVQSGPWNSVVWNDVGAGPMHIAANSYGGVPANNVLGFDVSTGAAAGFVRVLTLDGSGRGTFGGPLSVAGALTVSGASALQGATTINSSLSVSTTGIFGQALTVQAGAPALSLPGIAGGVANTIQWSDQGAGPMALQLNSYGGVPANNVMRFSVAAGSSGASVVPLTLDGANRALMPGDSFFGAGNVSPSITNGFPYLPYMGGGPTGTPAWAASTAMVPVIFGASLRLYAYLSGAWHYVTFT